MAYKEYNDHYRQIRINPEDDMIAVGCGTVWLFRGKCVLCDEEGDVLEADPEQAGLSVVPMCQSCINNLFHILQQMREKNLPRQISQEEHITEAYWRGYRDGLGRQEAQP